MWCSHAVDRLRRLDNRARGTCALRPESHPLRIADEGEVVMGVVMREAIGVCVFALLVACGAPPGPPETIRAFPVKSMDGVRTRSGVFARTTVRPTCFVVLCVGGRMTRRRRAIRFSGHCRSIQRTRWLTIFWVTCRRSPVAPPPCGTGFQPVNPLVGIRCHMR